MEAAGGLSGSLSLGSSSDEDSELSTGAETEAVGGFGSKKSPPCPQAYPQVSENDQKSFPTLSTETWNVGKDYELASALSLRRAVVALNRRAMGTPQQRGAISTKASRVISCGQRKQDRPSACTRMGNPQHAGRSRLEPQVEQRMRMEASL